MWLIRLCETVALANRLRGRSVCVAVALAQTPATRRFGRQKEDLRTALMRDARQVRGYVRRIVQPRRRVRLPGRILV
jgi:hypothetical protein